MLARTALNVTKEHDMLFDQKGKPFNPDNLPQGHKAREAVLATLREVLVPRRPGKHEGFKLQQRARFKGV